MQARALTTTDATPRWFTNAQRAHAASSLLRKAFRDELQLLHHEDSRDLRERNRLGLLPGKEGIVAAHKILHEHAPVVSELPVECARTGRPTSTRIWLPDEMQLASVPGTVDLQRADGRPGDR